MAFVVTQGVARTDKANEGSGVVVSAQPLNAEIISDPIDMRGMRRFTINVDYVRAGAATGWIMSIDQSPDGVTDWGEVMNEAATPPDKNLNPQTWTRTASVSEVVAFAPFEAQVTPGPWLRCRFNDISGATAADTLSVQAFADAF